MNRTITLAVYALFMLGVALTPIVVANYRKHPHRWLITVLAVPCTLFCTPLPMIVWAFWRIPITIQLDHYCYKIPKPENLFALFEANNEVFNIAVRAYCSAADDYHQKDILLAMINNNQVAWTKSRYYELASEAKRLKTHTLNWKQVSDVLHAAGERNLNQIMKTDQNR